MPMDMVILFIHYVKNDLKRWAYSDTEGRGSNILHITHL